MYAIVDIETTGGNAQFHKITEIAIFLHDGESVVDQFHSLINPQRPIPKNITYLTGITNAMVANAPTFEDISSKITEITQNAIFVAHNVNFDYSFIKQEFQLLGITFERKKLCTVRLSRKLFPGLPSYSLGNICQHFSITINDRHRANGDAQATVILFEKLLKKDVNKEVIKFSLKRNSKEGTIASNIESAIVDNIPASTGIYRFHDKKGVIMYIGKAQNLNNRVKEHFSGHTHTKSRNMFGQNIHKVTYQETGSELIALLLENEEIKKHFPRHNRTNKSFELNFGIYKYQDQLGYERMAIGKAGKRDKPFLLFQNESEALSYLLKINNQYKLCLRLLGIIKSNNKCSLNNPIYICKTCHNDENPTEYNQRLEKAIENNDKNFTYVIQTAGRNEEEKGFVYIENGKFMGYGYVDISIQKLTIDSIKNSITACYDTQDSQKILKQYLVKAKLIEENPIKVFMIS